MLFRNFSMSAGRKIQRSACDGSADLQASQWKYVAPSVNRAIANCVRASLLPSVKHDRPRIGAPRFIGNAAIPLALCGVGYANPEVSAGPTPCGLV